MVLGIAFVLLVVVMGAGIFKRMMDAQSPPPPAQPSGPVSGAPQVTLYFAAADSLAPETRQLDPCHTQEECIISLVAELANGPVGDLFPAIPPDTVAEGVTIEGDMAIVDLSSSFAAGVPRGSTGEMHAVYSIVNTICRNNPAITRVLLRSGHQVPELGHLDLREPLSPDFTLERQAP